MILSKVSRRARLIAAERRLAMVAFFGATIVYLVTKFHGFAAMVAAVIFFLIALKITSWNEDAYFEVQARRRWRRSRSATGEKGSWYG